VLRLRIPGRAAGRRRRSAAAAPDRAPGDRQASSVVSGLLKVSGILPDGFQVEQSSLHTLAHLDYNVALLICTGSLTLLVQRVLPNRSGAPV
jgi:hypothetical protein